MQILNLRFCCYLFILLLSFSGLSVSQVKNKVELKAVPFELTDVKLLDGPFKNAMELDAAYLLEIEPDRLLSWFRKEAGLQPKDSVYGGWESETIAGHSLGHYLSACAMMYASTGDKRFADKVNYITAELDTCQQVNGDGFAAAFPNGKKAFKEIAAGDIRPKPFDLNGIWVPWYTLHKQFAGLLDAHHYCGSTLALTVAKKLADWAYNVTSNLTDEKWQLMLSCEHGGMNEVLAELYSRTGDEKYLQLSRKFHHRFVLDPLKRSEDSLKGLHANTQIPKITGLARRYEIDGDINDLNTAKFFWDRVVHHHSYVIGGNSESESFGAPDSLNYRLGINTCETCNTYNMLKLTKHLFSINPSADYADYYERALYNHILASQQPDSGMFCYYVTLKPGAFKEYSDRFNSFWCCVGTGMENHSKYGESIYFHNSSNTELWVNLYIASELNWGQKGIILKQETNYPESGNSTLIINCSKPQSFTLNLRYPYWAEKGIEVKVNGEEIAINQSKGSYITIFRLWNNNDRIEVVLPFSTKLEPMPDNKSRAAILYGPLVLAGELGSKKEKITRGDFYVPVITANTGNIAEWIKPLGEPLTFVTANAAKPKDLKLYPFYKMHNKRYSVYWDFMTEDQYAVLKEDYKNEKRQLKFYEEHSVDFVQPGDTIAEKAHNYKGKISYPGDAGELSYRYASREGWFSYDLAVNSDESVSLLCTYWGGDSGKRMFDVLVDDAVIATQSLNYNKPGRFFDVKYKIPHELIKNKDKVTVRFIPKPENLAGGVFGVRILQIPNNK
jgi:DUF1680 family protein